MIRKLHVFIFFLFFAIFYGFGQGADCGLATSLTVNGPCDALTTISDGTQDTPNISGCTGTFNQEGWYSFDVSGGPLDITITATVSDRDLFLQLISSTTNDCNNLVEESCANAFSLNGAQTETITANLTDGTYFIKVVDVRTNGNGAMNLMSICVTAAAPPCNPPTQNAVTGITTTSGTISWSAASPVPSGYEYVVSTTNTTPVGAGTTTTNLSELIAGLTINTTYYVFVRSDCGGGNFSAWTVSEQFTTLAVPPPANDDCSGAIAIGTNADQSCTVFGSGTIENATDSGENNCGGTEDDDVWFSFVATSTVQTVTLFNIVGGTTDLYHAVYDGTSGCGSLGAALVCSDPNSSIVPGLTLGNTYYVQVYSWTGTSGQTSTFDICIGTPPPPPANDECSGAISVLTNPDQSCTNFGSGTIQNATNSGEDNCGGIEDDDVWFSFTATSTVHTIDLTNIVGSTTDLYHAVYAGNCGALGAAILCSDPNSSTVTGLTLGNTYYIQVYSWTGTTGQTSTFDICIGSPPPPPSNDDPCTAAVVLTNPDQSCTNIGSGTIYSATDSGISGSGCFGTDDDDVWFSFIATSTSHTFDISNITGSTTDLYHAVYGGPCATPGSALLCSDPNSSALSGLTVGSTYYVQVYSWTAVSGQTSSFDICIGTPPPPPSNTDCSGAIELTPGLNCSYVTYTNAQALDSSVADPGCAFYSGGDVWFSIVVPASGEITIDSQAGVITDSGMALYSGTCGSLTLMDCDDDGSANGLMSSITQTGLTPGETLYVRFWEFGNNNNGTFGICVTTPIPPGTNGVSICVGDPSEAMTTDITCTASGTTSLGNIITGNLDASSDPVALQPLIFIQSADPCAFDTETANYTAIDFTVSVTGTYVFAMETPVPYFDGMGYIVVNDGNFVPGSCATGTWIAGDDDDGPALDPQITANLTTGVNYTLYTTKYSFGNTTHTGPFTWNVTTPSVEVEWYTTQTGGTAIGTGAIFNPVGVVGSGLTDTNTAGTTTYWVGCPGSSDPRIQVDYVITDCGSCVIWTGANNSTDWYEPLNWTPATVPTATDCVIIAPAAFDPILTYPGIPVPPTPGEALNLTVQNNGILEIASDKVLTVTEDVTVDLGGTFIIRSGASLVQIDDSFVNSGEIRMERTVTGLTADDYVYWSAPVANFGVANISPGTSTNYIWEWIPTVGNNFGQWQNTTEAMIQGKGYIVKDIVGTATAGTPLFVGVPNNGVITKQINRGTYTGIDYTGPGDTDVTALDDNWNLIGNPYPSAIAYADFIAANSYIDIDGTIYLWTHQSPPSAIDSPFYQDFLYNYTPNDYIEHNMTGPNPPGFNGYIGAGQAFFVLMNDNFTQTETVTFNNAMRGPTYDNTIFYEPIERHRLWLDLIAPGNLALSTLIGYVDGATNGNDRLFDGYEFPGAFISFYSLMEDIELSIQGRSLPFDEMDTVPLGMVIPVNETYRIAINTVDGLFENEEQAVLLEDTYTNSIHDLRISPYSFTSEPGTFNDRFILRYSNDTLGTDDVSDASDIIIISNDHGIQISSRNNPIDSVTIYDLLGRVIIDVYDLNTMYHSFENLQLSKGAYIVRAKSYNGRQKIKKVVH